MSKRPSALRPSALRPSALRPSALRSAAPRLIALFLAACMLLTACSTGEEEEVPELLEPVGVTMDTALVTRQDMAKVKTYTGIIQPASYEVAFSQSGTVEDVYVSYGDSVEEGDILATLEQDALAEEIESLMAQIEYQQQVNELTLRQLELEVELAQAELEAMKTSGASDTEIGTQNFVVEEKELNLSQMEETLALEMTHMEEELASLEDELGQNTLTAPCSGTVVYVDTALASGSTVEAYSTMFVITDDETLYAVTAQISDSTLENAVRVTAEVGGETYEVTEEPYSSEDQLTMLLSSELEAKSRFILNDADDIQAGDTVVISVTVQEREDVLTVPVNAIYTDTTGKYVYVVVDSKRSRASVQVGLTTDTLAEITDGLEEGDEVYVPND